MAHQHARAHQLVRRQRNRDEDEEEDVETVVSVVFKTMPKTFSGDAVWVTKGKGQTLIEPMVRPTSADEDEPTSKTRATSAKSTSATSTRAHKGKGQETEETSTASPTKFATTLMVASSSPSLTGAVIAAATGLDTAPSESPSSFASASATAAPAATPMSGGAKAGLALGILFGIGLLLGGVLFLYRRKKNQVAAQKQADNNEKATMGNGRPPHIVEPATSERTMPNAPRLSLRPVTQFSPTFGAPQNGGSLHTLSAFAGPQPPSKDQSLSPETSGSAWERRAPGNAGLAQNPFNDSSALSSSPPQDPFGDAQSAANAPAPVNDFGNPAAAIAAAEAAPAAALLPRTPSIPRKQLPSPVIPASPAWTDDIPASPGPAPSGPPPIAMAGGFANGPGPAPVNNVHRIQLDFKPSMQDELELRAGQLVRMLHEYDDGWALCLRMDRTQQGVVPRTCLSKHPVKPRSGPGGPPRQGPPGPRVRGPPMGPPMEPMGPGGIPQPRPLTPSGRNSPAPGRNSPAPGRMSPVPGRMSLAPCAMPPMANQGPPRPAGRMSPAPGPAPRGMPPQNTNIGPARARASSNAPYAGSPRSMSPGPYGGGPQAMAPPPQMGGRPRANSASQALAPRAPAAGPSPMNPNGANAGANAGMAIPPRKPVPGMAL